MNIGTKVKVKATFRDKRFQDKTGRIKGIYPSGKYAIKFDDGMVTQLEFSEEDVEVLSE